MNDVRIEFVQDEAYYREFHEEWVAALGRGWRIDAVMKPIFATVGLCCIAYGLLADLPEWTAAGVIAFGAAVLEYEKGRRKKAEWIAYSLRQPWGGKPLLMVIEDRRLVQIKDYDGDPRFERTGELVDTPNGYLLRYRSDGISVPSRTFSRVSGSVYIPHRAIKPAMTRAEFRALLDTA